MAMHPRTPADEDAMREMFGPQQIDQMVRQAISPCWMGLPKEKRTVEEVDSQIRRIVDRALRDMHEDSRQFGIGLGPHDIPGGSGICPAGPLVFNDYPGLLIRGDACRDLLPGPWKSCETSVGSKGCASQGTLMRSSEC